MDLIIAVADPNADDVRALLDRHLTFARLQSPPEHVHALNTGAMDAFAPARTLYRRAGFRPCPPFGPYTVNPYSVCMTLALPA
ncbi:MAG: hypothetical protein ACRDOA_06300 [Streptosporangiaceae bacterium]